MSCHAPLALTISAKASITVCTICPRLANHLRSNVDILFDLFGIAWHTESVRSQSNHPKTSAKNPKGEDSRPFTRDDFHKLLKRAITTPAQNPAPKSKEELRNLFPNVK